MHKKFAQAAKTFIYSSTKGATGIDRESEEDSEQWNFYFTEEYKGNEGVRHGIEVGFNIWSDFDTGFVRENAKASIWRCFGEASTLHTRLRRTGWRTVIEARSGE